ncbi:hypothetical protein C2E23DRAFT_858262 [Lenzites betulinus]|nr:hypothetical protein C2E23DRAFT_858262 [Lenzites betulinus]
MRCFAILALAAAVSAANLSRRQAAYPACSLPCLASADFGSCDPSDDNCLCHSAAFINSTTTCITSSCSGDDLKTAEAAAQSACLSVGVTLSSTPSASQTAPASSAATSASASASSPASSASTTPNSAASRGANALVALAAVGAAAFVL